MVLLKDMLDAARKIQTYVRGKLRTDLETDDELIGYAIVKAIEIIGEAANYVSEETRADLPSIEWSDMIGMRNRLIHGYSAINYDIVRDVATINVLKLNQELEKAIVHEDSEKGDRE